MDQQLGTHFPFRQHLSLRPLIAFWQSLADAHDDPGSSFVRAMLEEIRAHKWVGAETVTFEELAQGSPLVKKLMTAIFPLAAMDRHVAAAIKPFELAPFYATPSFGELGILAYLDPGSDGSCPMSPDEMVNARTMMAYHLILDRLYGATADFNLPFVVGGATGSPELERYFQIEFDPRFLEVKVHGQKPRLSPEDIAALCNDPMNTVLWRSVLPAERFGFHGFGILRATEITSQQVLSLIKNDLLNRRDFAESEGILVLQRHIRSLLRDPDIEVGLIALEESDSGRLDTSRVVGRSLLLSDLILPECSRANDSAYGRALSSRRPVFEPNLVADESRCTGLEYHVRNLGYGSLGVFPLLEGGEVIGLLELVSRRPGAISARIELQLEEVTPLLSTALNRIMEERDNRIEALIKRQFTAIHPVVEWRFREEALKQMGSSEGAGPSGAIVFEEVYPLYGLSDIRNSSSFRADAIQEDLTEQLGLALAVIIEASAVSPQPALDELGFRIERQIDELKGVLAAGEESEPLRLLHSRVEPLFEKLGGLGSGVVRRIEEYRNAVDPHLGMVYRKRKDFEAAITMINDTLSRFLEEQEEVAQQLAPHYFEKYRTDGVDYNIYAGASLHRGGQFNELDLTNLRLWQLMTMAGCAMEIKALRPSLPLDLEVAHLVLVQSQPLAIRFRPDEKKFDVDGAYNIRYEIVKKRIDKAEVRGTRERLTQPGKIAVVYSLASEQREYQRYFAYLERAGYLEGGVELLEIEPLQGVHGLKAMRVTVAADPPKTEFLVDILPARISRAT